MENSILTISYKIKGTIDQEHINDFFERLGVIAIEDKKMNLVLETYQIDSLRNLNTFFSSDKSRNAVLKSLRKFALIADANWIEDLGDFIDFLTPSTEVEVFDRSEREEAKAWVDAPTKKEDRELQKRIKQGYAHLV